MNELDLFAAVIAIAEPGERAALLERECAGRPDLRNRIDQLVSAHFKSNALLDVPETDQTSPHASNGSETASLPIAAEVAGDGHRRSVQAAPADRRGGHGLGLDGRPDRTGQAPGRGQADPGRTRSVADDPVAVRGRAAGDRGHGPPAYCQASRRRHDGRGLALLCHGAGQRDPAQRLLRRTQAEHSRPAPALHADLLGGAACPPEGDHPPRPEADQHPGRESRRQAGAQGDRLWTGEGHLGVAAQRAHAVYRLRQRDGHAALHGARAGEFQRGRYRHPGRRLRAGRDSVRAVDGHDADHA